VASALGRGRIRELPVRLDYRFTGSMLRSSAVARALWDTLAIFYRLRILRTYQRKRRLLAAAPPLQLPLVSVVGDHAARAVLDYPRLESVSSPHQAHGELLAVLKPGARPSGNWVNAAVPFFANADVAAVVTPTVAPLRGSLREMIAAAVVE